MVYPEQNRLKRWILDTYIQYSVKQHFEAINFNRIDVVPNQSVLMIANHFSYWDGLILYYLNRQITGKNFHVMLLEQTALQQPMLKYGGAFSIAKGSKEIITSLNYAAELLSDPKNMVLIFPQGKLYSNFSSEIKFEKGTLKILEKAAGSFQLLMATTFVENMQHKKPLANVYLANAGSPVISKPADLESMYQQHYQAALARQTKIVV